RAHGRGRVASTHGKRGTQIEILGARDLVVIPQPLEVVLDQVELEERIQKAPIRWNSRGSRPGLDRREAMLIIGVAEGIAPYPAILQAGRPAPVDLSPLVLVLELVDDLAAIPERVGLHVVQTVDAGRPGRVE